MCVHVCFFFYKISKKSMMVPNKSTCWLRYISSVSMFSLALCLPVYYGGLSSFNCPSTKKSLENTNYILFYFPTTKTALGSEWIRHVSGKGDGQMQVQTEKLIVQWGNQE